jgi:ABC-type molybdate transport system substrate-binding protein
MQAFRKRAGAFLLACWVLGSASPVIAANVTVFAAASLKEALDQQARQFEGSTGNKVVVSYGASNALAKQIEAGAPADIFISADLDWVDYVDQRHLLMPDTRVNLLRNTLVLVAPASSKSALKIGPNFGLAAALGQAGRFDEAKQALQKAIAVAPKSFDMYVRHRAPWFRPEDYTHMLEGLRKAGWEG